MHTCTGCRVPGPSQGRRLAPANSCCAKLQQANCARHPREAVTALHTHTRHPACDHGLQPGQGRGPQSHAVGHARVQQVSMWGHHTAASAPATTPPCLHETHMPLHTPPYEEGVHNSHTICCGPDSRRDQLWSIPTISQTRVTTQTHAGSRVHVRRVVRQQARLLPPHSKQTVA